MGFIQDKKSQVDGQVYSLRQEVFPGGESPLRVERAGEDWNVSFRGKLNENDEVDLQARFTARFGPIDFTSHMPAVRMATGIANEK